MADALKGPHRSLTDKLKPAVVAHYDETYYAAGHGGFQKDPRYYRLLALYWRHLIFTANGLDPDGPVLDFGAGLGQVTAALPEVTCYDVSSYALRRLREAGRNAVSDKSLLPRRHFSVILASHSLEHCLDPAAELAGLHEFIRPGGTLVLVLPLEKHTNLPALARDIDRHLYCWTFQTFTNLLDATGWQAVTQKLLLSPVGLRTLGLRLGLKADRAVCWSARFAGLLGRQDSMMTIAAEK
jgi:SAM-dependent methyltransferase